jgi:hypothetical protein
LLNQNSRIDYSRSGYNQYDFNHPLILYKRTNEDVTMPSHRPQGRMARAEPSSRKGQYYDSNIEAVFHTDLGDITAREYRAKLDRKDSVERFSFVRKNNLVDSKFSRKSCTCGGKINIQADGKAICNNSSCSTVFNDGGNIEGMIQVNEKYDSGRIEVRTNKRQEREALLPNRRWVTKHFMKRSSY